MFTQRRKDAKIAEEILIPSALRFGLLSSWRERRRMTENEIGKIIVDSAVKVHKELGPGLLERVYEAVLAQELKDRGLSVEQQVSVLLKFVGSNLKKDSEPIC
jgi:hypothetical protein